MRFFEQKKTLKPDDLSVLKDFEVFLAEWTGHELCPYIVENQCFYFVKK
jgi:hypothetical protein